jgi:hypothetical protein
VKVRAQTPTRTGVRVLGVDDWAWRKRQRYGTLLMDLEHGRMIELLPDRSARSFAAWLRGQPTVEIISRDGCGLYADGARQGAPAAQQVTDLYHLVSNLVEAFERDLQRLQIETRAEPPVAQMIDRPPTLRPTLIEARRQRCRQARLDRFQAMIDLGRRGHRHEAIAKQVGISAGTVSRGLHARAFPERRQIRSDRRREQAPFWLRYARGGKLPARETHYSSRRIASLLLNPERRSPNQNRVTWTHSSGRAPKRAICAGWPSSFGPCCDGERRTGPRHGCTRPAHFVAQFARVLGRDVDAVKQAHHQSVEQRAGGGPRQSAENDRASNVRASGLRTPEARVLPWESTDSLEKPRTESA